jgi:hypothetical protein
MCRILANDMFDAGGSLFLCGLYKTRASSHKTRGFNNFLCKGGIKRMEGLRVAGSGGEQGRENWRRGRCTHSLPGRVWCLEVTGMLFTMDCCFNPSQLQ